ncbi:MAG TPA: cupredoxin domain-containing protein [Solirubrobacterales bacterium]|nr:cupredoxin domain-containing protein [Solirubrobacterales bacterium]
MQRPRFWVPTAAAALLLFALLAGEGNAAGPTAGASAAKSVSIVNFAFKPGTLTVKRGARVAFTNTANTAHTATKGGSFDTKRIEPEKTKTVQFNQRGTFAYHCKIHPSMKGKVIVE